MKRGLIRVVADYIEEKLVNLGELLFGHDKVLGPDPVKHCMVYKTHGCAHVDGYLCDMRTCKIKVTATSKTDPNNVIWMTESNEAENLDARFDINRIVCAAVRAPDGALILGARHWDGIMRETYDNQETVYHLLDEYIKGRPPFAGHHEYEEGFIDKFGKYKNRQEAWIVAVGANQIIREVGGNASKGGTLYSENLY